MSWDKKACVEEGYYEGSELEGLQFAVNYYTWLTDEFRPYLRGCCLEVGAGLGTFSKFLLNTDIECLYCIEPAGNLFPLLRARLQCSPKPVVAVQATLEAFSGLADRSFDCIVCVNVLEHIEDDRKAMAQMRQLLKPDGYLCLFVPALPWLYGTLDVSFGHHRRYTKRQLEELARQANFTVKKLRFFNHIGVITWFLAGKVLRWRTLDRSKVAIYDRIVTPYIRRLESFLSPPWGQSLLMVAQNAK